MGIHFPVCAGSIKKNDHAIKNQILDLKFGYGLIVAPKYEGSSNSVIRAVPFFNIKYKNLTFNPVSGITVNFFNHKNWSLDYGLGLNLGRDPEKDLNFGGLKKSVGLYCQSYLLIIRKNIIQFHQRSL